MPQNAGQSAIAETIPRKSVTTNTLAIGATGVLLLTAIFLPAGVTITNVHFLAGTTAQSSGTHSWVALYDNNLRLIDQSNDDTGAAAVAANTVYTKALKNTQKTGYSGLYYVGIMVAGIGMPQGAGLLQPTNAGLQGIAPILCGTSTGSLTNIAPDPAAALTAVVSIPYMYVT